MRRILVGAAALVLGLALVGTASAGPKSGGSSHGSIHNSHERYGNQFKGGYSYRGREHSQWSHRYWWGKYGCYTYYCPSTCAWYYWYQPGNCYYPCSYVGSATPVAEAPPLGVPSGVTQMVNVTNNSPGAATGASAPVMPPAPPG